MDSIANRLARARKEAGLSQKALGARVGVSQGAIGNVEKGIRAMPRDIVGLATALNVSPQWLASGKGPMRTGGPDTTPIVERRAVFLQQLYLKLSSDKQAELLNYAEGLSLPVPRPIDEPDPLEPLPRRKLRSDR